MCPSFSFAYDRCVLVLLKRKECRNESRLAQRTAVQVVEQKKNEPFQAPSTNALLHSNSRKVRQVHIDFYHCLQNFGNNPI